MLPWARQSRSPCAHLSCSPTGLRQPIERIVCHAPQYSVEGIQSLEKWVAVANISETFLHSYERVRDTRARQRQILEDQYLGERALLWGEDHKLVITSWPAEPAHLDYIRKVMGYSELVNASPANPSLSLSRDIIQDSALLAQIIEYCRDADCVHLVPYSTTQQFLELAIYLVELGLPLDTDESCRRENVWLRDYLDTKGGFREFILPLQDRFSKFRIPEGFWVRDWEEAARVVVSFLSRGRSCLCKPNRGEGGAGIVTFDSRDYQRQADIESAILERLQADAYLQLDSVIVEEYIEPDRSVAGGSPSIDLYISPKGQDDIRLLAIETQVLSPEGIFQGVEIGDGILPADVEEAIMNDSFLIAQRMREWGYVGPFDIDMVLDRAGRIWPVESNTRRTGASHAIDAATFLFGPEFWKAVTVFTFDHLELYKEGANFAEIRKQLSNLLFPINGIKHGLLLDIAASLKNGSVGYLIFAESAAHARSIHDEASMLLKGM